MPVFRRSPHPVVQRLEQMPLFSGCSHHRIRQIASATTQVDATTGRVLTVAGAPGPEFFMVITGTAGVWRDGVRCDAVGPGSFFGEPALLDRGTQTADVIAETDMQLLVLTRREVQHNQFLIRPVLERMLVELSDRFRRLTEEQRTVRTLHLEEVGSVPGEMGRGGAGPDGSTPATEARSGFDHALSN